MAVLTKVRNVSEVAVFHDSLADIEVHAENGSVTHLRLFGVDGGDGVSMVVCEESARQLLAGLKVTMGCVDAMKAMTVALSHEPIHEQVKEDSENVRE